MIMWGLWGLWGCFIREAADHFSRHLAVFSAWGDS
jgi:hypothetical protein